MTCSCSHEPAESTGDKADSRIEFHAFEELARRLVRVPKDEVGAEREREKAAKRG